MRVMYLSASGELDGGGRTLLDVAASVRHAQREWNIHLLSASGKGGVTFLGAIAQLAAMRAYLEGRCRVTAGSQRGPASRAIAT